MWTIMTIVGTALVVSALLRYAGKGGTSQTEGRRHKSRAQAC